ncbi:hypothetical protein DQ04_01351090 [Trypanosoma grayi]|uniref:hypothetical protein n=1 Tax=Trypanosoma grayi TaxID=71804 RepID=UPI0004F42ECD|nr:hypothetical protein DQ04_01351090 [Trypanosoma grayi]KEG12886.1 hypothetical protein DQ04_01351090 [Trypanosoma grayi]
MWHADVAVSYDFVFSMLQLVCECLEGTVGYLQRSLQVMVSPSPEEMNGAGKTSSGWPRRLTEWHAPERFPKVR